jgi:hypothetical protein
MVCALVMHTEHDERLFAGALPHGGDEAFVTSVQWSAA